MESHDIGTSGDLIKVMEIHAVAGSLPGRIVEQHLETKITAPCRDNAAHMSDAHHTEHSRPAQAGYGGKHVLRHSRSIASGRIGHNNAAPPAIIHVDMVGTDSGGGYHPATRAVEQRRVTPRAGTHHKRVGIPDGCRRYLLRSKIAHCGTRVEHSLDIRNMALYNDQRLHESVK